MTPDEASKELRRVKANHIDPLWTSMVAAMRADVPTSGVVFGSVDEVAGAVGFDLDSANFPNARRYAIAYAESARRWASRVQQLLSQRRAEIAPFEAAQLEAAYTDALRRWNVLQDRGFGLGSESFAAYLIPELVNRVEKVGRDVEEIWDGLVKGVKAVAPAVGALSLIALLVLFFLAVERRI